MSAPALPGAIEALVAAGELALLPRGSVGMSGRPLRLLRWCDERFRSWAGELGAQEWRFPAAIPRVTLERAAFFESFGALAPHVDGEDAHLTTAACYQLYPHLGGRPPPGDGPLVLTLVGECYRNETLAERPLARQWAFQMREIVFVGRPEEVRRLRAALAERTAELAAGLGLAAQLEAASDPFFGAQSRGRALLQQLKQLKHELRVPDPAGEPLAIASFNDHEDFFGRAFGIALPGGEAASSGCAAFGLERWVYALVTRHGADVQPWELVG